MDFEVPPLPYAKDALEPVMSKETFDYHYEKHHKTYMTNLKGLIGDKPEAQKSLVEIVRTSSAGVFNNAAQVWNHTFFWESMKPNGGGEPKSGPVADLIKRDFGDWQSFRTKFIEAGMNRFGSGWAWLVLQDGKAQIVSTPNADTPLKDGIKCLLVADVWEHAYYLDYQNRRDSFLETFCDKLINWDFVQKQL